MAKGRRGKRTKPPPPPEPPPPGAQPDVKEWRCSYCEQGILHPISWKDDTPGDRIPVERKKGKKKRKTSSDTKKGQVSVNAPLTEPEPEPNIKIYPHVLWYRDKHEVALTFTEFYLREQERIAHELLQRALPGVQFVPSTHARYLAYERRHSSRWIATHDDFLCFFWLAGIKGPGAVVSKGCRAVGRQIAAIPGTIFQPGHASLLPAHLLPPPALLFNLPPTEYPPSFPALEVVALPGHQLGPVVVDAWISYWERINLTEPSNDNAGANANYERL